MNMNCIVLWFCIGTGRAEVDLPR